MMTWLGLELQTKPPSSGLDLQWGMPSNSSNMYASRSSATNEPSQGRITKGHFIHSLGPAGAPARLSPQSGPTLWTFLGPNLVTCKVVRPDSRARWSWGLSFIELTVVNARCSQQLSFTTLNTMGDDIYRVVVSELKLGPTRLINWGLWIYSNVKMFL